MFDVKHDWRRLWELFCQRQHGKIFSNSACAALNSLLTTVYMEPQSAAFLTKANSVTTHWKKDCWTCLRCCFDQHRVPAVVRPTQQHRWMSDWLMSSLNIQATCMFDHTYGSSEHFGPEGFSQQQVGSLDLPDNRTVSRHGGNRRHSWLPQRRWDDAALGQHHHIIVPNACNSWAALYHLSEQHSMTTTPEKRILVSWEPNTHKLMTYTAASSAANQEEGSHAESSRQAQQMPFMESRRSNVLGVQAFQRLVEGTTESAAEEYFNEINIWRTEQVEANMDDGPGDAGQQDWAATTWETIPLTSVAGWSCNIPGWPSRNNREKWWAQMGLNTWGETSWQMPTSAADNRCKTYCKTITISHQSAQGLSNIPISTWCFSVQNLVRRYKRLRSGVKYNTAHDSLAPTGLEPFANRYQQQLRQQFPALIFSDCI